jgi:hypothetical protein
MAGQLTIDTLKASSGVLATQNGMTGIAKAWVQFNGSGTIASSFNVSSITRNGTGDYTINFSTTLANANYCCVGTSTYNTAQLGTWAFPYSSAPTTSAARVATYSYLFNPQDNGYNNFAFFGA